MDIKTRFEIGQTVFVLSWSDAFRIRGCDTCARSGKVQINGQEFVCPACQGRSAHRQFAGRAWYVAQHNAKVGKIGVEVIISEEWRRDSHGFRPDSAYSDFETRITYMTDQSGIGSGSVLDEKDVFSSLTEAEIACAERNAGNLTDQEGAVLKPEAR
jgi:hypothetical protein